MSIIVENDSAKTPLETARRSVLSAQDIRGEEVFHGVDVECKLIISLICATILKVEERSWSSSAARNYRHMGS